MTDDQESRTIELTVVIDAPVEAVWEALTRAEELVKWFPLEARVTPGPGGRVWIAWPGMEAELGIEVWEPARHLRLRDLPRADSAASARPLLAIDYFLEGRGGGTVLRLVHSGFGRTAAWDAEYDDTNRGWAAFLANLRHYLGRHRGKPCRQIMLPVPLTFSCEQAWVRLLGPRGLGLTAPPQAGQRYTGRAAAGDALSGVVDLALPPYVFGATVEAWDDAIVRVNFERPGGTLYCWFVILTYGLPEAAAEGIRSRWEPMLQALFAESGGRP